VAKENREEVVDEDLQLLDNTNGDWWPNLIGGMNMNMNMNT